MIPQFRCSELNTRIFCHGSFTAAPLVPKRVSTEGDEGSQLHYLIAKKLVEEHGAVPPEGGLVPPVLSPTFRLSPFSAWIVEWAVRHVLETIPPDWTIMVEQSFEYEYILPRPVMIDGVLVDRILLTGHIDILGMSPDGKKVHGMDWKTGTVGADAAEDNWQAAGYLGLVKMAWPDIEHGEFTLAQPRLDEDAGVPRISTVTRDGAGLDAINVLLAEEINAALEDRYTVNSGIKQCKYCPVGWRCPAIQAELEFMKATLTQDKLAALQRQPNDGELGDFVVAGRSLSGPLEIAEDLLHKRIDLNGSLDCNNGIRVTRKTQGGSYEVPDPEAFYRALRRELPSDSSIAKVMKPSMARIKDEIAEVQNVPKTSKIGRSAATVFDDNLRPLVVQKTKNILVFS